MSWIKIDDLLPHHRKVRAMDRQHAFAGFGLYAASIAFAQREFTDGVILRADLPALIPGHRVSPALIAALVAVQLWDRLADGRDGWRVHDYLDHNDSAAVRRDKLARDAARKRGLPMPDSSRIPDGVHKESERTPDVAPRSSEKLLSEKRSKAPSSDSVDVPPADALAPGSAPGRSRDRGGSEGVAPPAPERSSPCAQLEATVGRDAAYRCTTSGRTWSQRAGRGARCPIHADGEPERVGDGLDATLAQLRSGG